MTALTKPVKLISTLVQTQLLFSSVGISYSSKALLSRYVLRAGESLLLSLYQ